MSLAAYLPSLAGGALIGLAAGGLRLATGQIAGISGILRRAITGPERCWRLAFLAGLITPGIIAGLAHKDAAIRGVEGFGTLWLVLAGLLVGLGTGLGNGCTSGHGICGLARLSPRSAVAVAVFMGSAAATVFVIRHALHLGGGQ